MAYSNPKPNPDLAYQQLDRIKESVAESTCRRWIELVLDEHWKIKPEYPWDYDESNRYLRQMENHISQCLRKCAQFASKPRYSHTLDGVSQQFYSISDWHKNRRSINLTDEATMVSNYAMVTMYFLERLLEAVDSNALVSEKQPIIRDTLIILNGLNENFPTKSQKAISRFTFKNAIKVIINAYRLVSEDLFRHPLFSDILRSTKTNISELSLNLNTFSFLFTQIRSSTTADNAHIFTAYNSITTFIQSFSWHFAKTKDFNLSLSLHKSHFHIKKPESISRNSSSTRLKTDEITIEPLIVNDEMRLWIEESICVSIPELRHIQFQKERQELVQYCIHSCIPNKKEISTKDENLIKTYTGYLSCIMPLMQLETLLKCMTALHESGGTSYWRYNNDMISLLENLLDKLLMPVIKALRVDALDSHVEAIPFISELKEEHREILSILDRGKDREHIFSELFEQMKAFTKTTGDNRGKAEADLYNAIFNTINSNSISEGEKLSFEEQLKSTGLGERHNEKQVTGISINPQDDGTEDGTYLSKAGDEEGTHGTTNGGTQQTLRVEVPPPTTPFKTASKREAKSTGGRRGTRIASSLSEHSGSLTPQLRRYQARQSTGNLPEDIHLLTVINDPSPTPEDFSRMKTGIYDAAQEKDILLQLIKIITTNHQQQLKAFQDYIVYVYKELATFKKGHFYQEQQIVLNCFTESIKMAKDNDSMTHQITHEEINQTTDALSRTLKPFTKIGSLAESMLKNLPEEIESRIELIEGTINNDALRQALSLWSDEPDAIAKEAPGIQSLFEAGIIKCQGKKDDFPYKNLEENFTWRWNTVLEEHKNEIFTALSSLFMFNNRPHKHICPYPNSLHDLDTYNKVESAYNALILAENKVSMARECILSYKDDAQKTQAPKEFLEMWGENHNEISKRAHRIFCEDLWRMAQDPEIDLDRFKTKIQEQEMLIHRQDSMALIIQKLKFSWFSFFGGHKIRSEYGYAYTLPTSLAKALNSSLIISYITEPSNVPIYFMINALFQKLRTNPQINRCSFSRGAQTSAFYNSIRDQDASNYKEICRDSFNIDLNPRLSYIEDDSNEAEGYGEDNAQTRSQPLDFDEHQDDSSALLLSGI